MRFIKTVQLWRSMASCAKPLLRDAGELEVEEKTVRAFS
jgi:hypothetical protein